MSAFKEVPVTQKKSPCSGSTLLDPRAGWRECGCVVLSCKDNQVDDSPSFTLGSAACWGRPLAGAAVLGAPGCNSPVLPDPKMPSIFETLIPGFKDMSEEEQKEAIKKFNSNGLTASLEGIKFEVGRRGHGRHGNVPHPVNTEHESGSSQGLHDFPTRRRQQCCEALSDRDADTGDALCCKDGVVPFGATWADWRIAQACNGNQKMVAVGCASIGRADAVLGAVTTVTDDGAHALSQHTTRVIVRSSEPLLHDAFGSLRAALVVLPGQAASVPDATWRQVAVTLNNAGSSSPADKPTSRNTRTGSGCCEGTVGADASRLHAASVLDGVRAALAVSTTGRKRPPSSASCGTLCTRRCARKGTTAIRATGWPPKHVSSTPAARRKASCDAA